MPSDTITQGLNRYAIGSKLRRLRLRKSMGLVELGKHSGLSPALLSKLERGVMYPTLPTLLRISLVFSVGLDYFFTSEPEPLFEIVRRAGRIRLPDTPGARKPGYYFESLDYPVPQPFLNSYLAEFTSSGSLPHQHPGIEFLFLVSGKLELQVRDVSHRLSASDAVYFDSTAPHAYRRIGTRRATAIVVTVSPRSEAP